MTSTLNVLQRLQTLTTTDGIHIMFMIKEI